VTDLPVGSVWSFPADHRSPEAIFTLASALPLTERMFPELVGCALEPSDSGASPPGYMQFVHPSAPPPGVPVRSTAAKVKEIIYQLVASGPRQERTTPGSSKTLPGPGRPRASESSSSPDQVPDGGNRELFRSHRGVFKGARRPVEIS